MTEAAFDWGAMSIATRGRGACKDPHPVELGVNEQLESCDRNDWIYLTKT